MVEKVALWAWRAAVLAVLIWIAFLLRDIYYSIPGGGEYSGHLSDILRRLERMQR